MTNEEIITALLCMAGDLYVAGMVSNRDEFAAQFADAAYHRFEEIDDRLALHLSRDITSLFNSIDSDNHHA